MQGLSAKAITSFSTLEITALPVVVLSQTLTEQEGGEAGPWPAQDTPDSLAPKPRDLKFVVAQPLMVRVRNLWRTTSNLYALNFVLRGTLGHVSF